MVLSKLRDKAMAFEAEHRIIPKSIGAVAGVTAALQAVTINASAEGGVDISTVTSEMGTQLVDLASKVGVACAAVVGAGLTLFGLKFAVQKVMSFFKSIGK